MTERPVFILVEPQLGENIGMSARTMYNFGFAHLRIVAPRDGSITALAKAASAGAIDQMQVEVFETLADAVADLQTLLATTARDRANQEVAIFTHDIIHFPSIMNSTTGILFGAERRGLTNAQIACCHQCFKIPVNEDFPSINLAQSVGIVAYALSSLGQKQQDGEKKSKDTAPQQRAKKEGVFALCDLITHHLKETNYFTKDNEQSKTLRIQSILHQADLDEQDIKLLFGVFRHCINKN